MLDFLYHQSCLALVELERHCLRSFRPRDWVVDYLHDLLLVSRLYQPCPLLPGRGPHPRLQGVLAFSRHIYRADRSDPKRAGETNAAR